MGFSSNHKAPWVELDGEEPQGMAARPPGQAEQLNPRFPGPVHTAAGLKADCVAGRRVASREALHEAMEGTH